MNTLKMGTAALAAWGMLSLGACDNASAVETRERTAVDTAQPIALTSATEAAAAPEAKPVLTASRSETVVAKVTRLYERNGADFGARSAEDYLAKVTAFTTKAPAGTETIKRPNGDTLLYQTATNTFAVVDRDGTPRTMFKPTTGEAYWTEQKERAPTFGQRRGAEG